MTNEDQEMYHVEIPTGAEWEDKSVPLSDQPEPEHGYSELPVGYQPLPEAGGVAWIDLYGTRIIPGEDGKQYRKVFKISLTCRAATPIAALDGLKAAIKHAEATYKLLPYQ